MPSCPCGFQQSGKILEDRAFGLQVAAFVHVVSSTGNLRTGLRAAVSGLLIRLTGDKISILDTFGDRGSTFDLSSFFDQCAEFCSVLCRVRATLLLLPCLLLGTTHVHVSTHLLLLHHHKMNFHLLLQLYLRHTLTASCFVCFHIVKAPSVSAIKFGHICHSNHLHTSRNQSRCLSVICCLFRAFCLISSCPFSRDGPLLLSFFCQKRKEKKISPRSFSRVILDSWRDICWRGSRLFLFYCTKRRETLTWDVNTSTPLFIYSSYSLPCDGVSYPQSP